MAAGDLTVFQEAVPGALENWAGTDTLKIALITSATAPTAATATPALADFTQVTAGGNYTAGGETLDTWTNMVTQSGAVTTIDDTGASVQWLQHASNPNNARYAVVYNDTQTTPVADACWCYIDLGADIDMTAGDLTITWNASGISTITIS